MKNKESALVLSAIELTKIGERLEDARGALKRLVEKGISFESDEMKDTLQACLSLELQWKTLEQRHLALRKETMRISTDMEAETDNAVNRQAPRG